MAVQACYAQRRDWLLAACERHLSGIAAWNKPGAGMFLFLEVTVADVDAAALLEPMLAAGVAILPAGGFRPDEGPSRAFRVSFAQLQSAEAADSAAAKIASVLRDEDAVAAAAEGIAAKRDAAAERVAALLGPPQSPAAAFAAALRRKRAADPVGFALCAGAAVAVGFAVLRRRFL